MFDPHTQEVEERPTVNKFAHTLASVRLSPAIMWTLCVCLDKLQGGMCGFRAEAGSVL